MKALLPHQKQVHNLAKEGKLQDTVLLWWAMGSGKTLGSLLCTTAIPVSAAALVLCAKTITGQWESAIDRFVRSDHCVCKNITVKHYNTLTTEDVCPADFQMCIVDESHLFRNTFSTSERAPKDLSYWIERILECPRIVYLTGTPIVSDPRELDTLHRMMRVSPKNPLDGRVFHYVPARDSKRYASTVMEVVECPMTYAQYMIYAANKRSEFELDVAGTKYTVVRPVRNTYNTALISTSNNPFPGMPEHSPKFMAMIKQLATGYDIGKKQVVYSHRLDSGIHAVRSMYISMYPGSKQNMYFIDGQMSALDRFNSVKRFNRGDHIARILFISDAASQGVDLRNVGALHILEPSIHLQDERQIINRAVRFRAHREKGATVQVYLYCSVFKEDAMDGPLMYSIQKMSMFDRDLDDRFIGEIRDALALRMKGEDCTIDEKIMRNRLVDEEGVQRALAEVKKSAYISVALFTRSAVIATVRDALRNSGIHDHAIMGTIESKIMKMRIDRKERKENLKQKRRKR